MSYRSTNRLWTILICLLLAWAAASPSHANRFEENFGDGADGDFYVGPEYTEASPYIWDGMASCRASNTYVVGENPGGGRTLQVADTTGFQVGDEIR